MEPALAVMAGLLMSTSIYLMLSRNLIKFLFGLVLISNAANLVIFTAGRLVAGAPALIPANAETLGEGAANALPQALILTAIVISFGLTTFALILISRAFGVLGTVDVDSMRPQETPAEDAYSFAHPPGLEVPGHETPGHETPGHETPNHETPGQVTPGHETPGRETPDQETRSHETPDQVTPDQVTPSHHTRGEQATEAEAPEPDRHERVA